MLEKFFLEKQFSKKTPIDNQDFDTLSLWRVKKMKKLRSEESSQRKFKRKKSKKNLNKDGGHSDRVKSHEIQDLKIKPSDLGSSP